MCTAAGAAFLLSSPALLAQNSAPEVPKQTDKNSVSLPDLTQNVSEIEVGVGAVSKDSFKFGDYTGLEQKGAYAVGNVDILRREAYDAGTGKYWSLTGTNLGLRSRNLRGEIGTQGDYKLWYEYDQLPKFQTDSAKTVFSGAGGKNLTLPAGWVAADTTAGMTQLDSSLQDLNVKHERKSQTFGFSKVLGNNWDFKASFRNETKEGTKITGAVIGNNDDNARSVLIPEPINYLTDQFDAQLGYTGTKGQMQVAYYLSIFRNRNNSLTWANPYAGVAGWDPGVDFSDGMGQLGLSPDNRFHQLMVSGGYNFTEKTRFTGNLGIGRMLQDQSFLPYTINPALAITTPLPRTSLDGRINTTQLALNLSSRPIPKLTLNASYRIDDRENRTPRSQYIYVGADSQNQEAVDSERARTNLPYGYRQNLLKLDAGYAIFKQTKLGVGYDNSEVRRTFSEVDKTKEETYRAELRYSPVDMFAGGMRLARSDRNGSEYHGTTSVLNSNSPEFIATLAPGDLFRSNPLLRKFYLADRTRNKLGVFGSLTPIDPLTLTLNADYTADDYKKSVFGLISGTVASYALDASLTPGENVTTYAFYNYQEFKSNLNGQDDAATGTGVNWSARQRDRIDTIGLGVRVNSIGGKLDVGGEYLYSRSAGNIDVTSGDPVLLPVSPLPELVTRVNGIRLYGKYKVDQSMSVRFNYLYKNLKSTDWALDGVAPATVAEVLTTGERAPRYSVHVLGVSLVYRYW